jgi:hypothetical protein
MAATIFYTITNGAMPITVELTPSLIPANVHIETGTYSFIDVEYGEYTLIFTDSNECVYEKEIIVDPFVTTTTTTVIPDNAFVVGQSQDTLLIFNENATNRSEHYFGDTPMDTNINLYLWFKTLNGEPLTSSKTIIYSISNDSSMVIPSTTGITTGGSYNATYESYNYLGVSLTGGTGSTGTYFTGFVKISDSGYTGTSYSFTATTVTGDSGTVNVIYTVYSGLSYNANNIFTYLDVSDQIHAVVTETMSGPLKTIIGSITFQPGFIETYFKYKYQKDLILPNYRVDLSAFTDWLDPNISLTGGTKTYGVVYVDGDNIVLKF